MSMGALYSGLGRGLSQAGENLYKFTLWDAQERRKENLERVKMTREDARYAQERGDQKMGYNEAGQYVSRRDVESGAHQGALYADGIKRTQPGDDVIDTSKMVKYGDGYALIRRGEDGKTVIEPLEGVTGRAQSTTNPYYFGSPMVDPETGEAFIPAVDKGSLHTSQIPVGRGSKKMGTKGEGEITEEKLIEYSKEEAKTFEDLRKEGYLGKAQSDGTIDVKKRIPEPLLDRINSLREVQGKVPLKQEGRGAPWYRFGGEDIALVPGETTAQAGPSRGGLSQAQEGAVAEGKKPLVTFNSKGYQSLIEVQITGVPMIDLVEDAKHLPAEDIDTYRQVIRNQLASKSQVSQFDALWARVHKKGGGGGAPAGKPAGTRSALPPDRRALFDQAMR